MALLIGLVDGPFSLVSFGIALLVAGVFLQAIDYALNFLREIRDVVVSENPIQQQSTTLDNNIVVDAPQKSMAELSAELSALSNKLGKA